MDACFNHAVVSALPSKAYKGVLGLTKEEIMQKYRRLVQASVSHSRPRPLPCPQAQLPLPPSPDPEDATVNIALPAVVVDDFAPDFDEGDDLEPEEQMVPAVQEITLAEFTADINKVLNGFCSQVLQAIPPPRHNNPNNLVFYHGCQDPNNLFTPSIIHCNNPDLWLAGFIQLQTHEPHHDDWEDWFEYLFPLKFQIIRQNQFGRPQNNYFLIN